MASEYLNNLTKMYVEAGIELLCVKHTLLAVAKAAIHRVKLGAKGNRWFEMSMCITVGS